MNPLQFKYTITLTQMKSPSQWNIDAMIKNLVVLRNQAYDTEAMLIEAELDRRGLKEAQEIINLIKNKND
jgi:hypothetical protein